MLTSAIDMFSIQYSLRVLHLADTAEAFRLDPKTLFSEVLDIEQVRTHRYVPTWPDVRRLFACLVNASGGQPVSLDFGKRLNLTSFGTLGIVIASMKNLSELLSFSEKMHRLSGLNAPAEIEEHNKLVYMRFTLRGWNVSGTIKPFVLESMTTLYLELFRELLPHPFQLESACFSHPAPRYLDLIRSQYGCPVEFNRSEDRLVFPAHFMDVPFSTYNPHIARAGVETCQQLLKCLPMQESMTDRVRLELINSVGCYPTLAAMAQRFFLEPRTLSRRLQQEGSSYLTLLTEAKSKFACQLLAETTSPIGDIAFKLGFCDEANFRRAFKKWHGITAAHYRKNH